MKLIIEFVKLKIIESYLSTSQATNIAIWSKIWLTLVEIARVRRPHSERSLWARRLRPCPRKASVFYGRQASYSTYSNFCYPPPDKRPKITYLISECLLIIKSMPLYQNRSTFPDFLSKYWIWFIYIILQYKQFLSKYYHPTFFITKRLYNIKLVNHYFKNFTCRLPS